MNLIEFIMLINQCQLKSCRVELVLSTGKWPQLNERNQSNYFISSDFNQLKSPEKLSNQINQEINQIQVKICEINSI